MPSQTGSIDLTSQVNARNNAISVASTDATTKADEAAKTATNYITADADGIKIHMTGESSTYQYQTATDTTFYVSGKKRTKIGGDGLHIYVDTNESQIASFTSSGSVVGKTAGSHFAQDATTATFYGTNGIDKNLSIETDNGVGVIKFNGDRSSINGFANILGLRSYGSSSSSDNGMITITAESEDVDTASGSIGQTFLWMYSDPSIAHAELSSYDNSGNFATVYVDGKNNEVDITGELKLTTSVLAKAYGGTGNTNGAAAKLVTPRTLYVALATVYDSSDPVQFDGSAGKALPISGTLAIAHGGTGGTTGAAARSNIGAAARSWTSLASSSNDTAMTYDLSDYYEVMFVARAGTDYVGSVVLPKSQLSTTSRQVYLSGGQNSSSGGRGFAVDATSTKATPAARRVDGTTTACTWWTYAR